MNASVKSISSATSAGHLHSLVLDALRPSGTEVQSRRRKHYDEGSLAELAVTITNLGVIEPIIVRPVEPPVGGTTHEIVAGERRWLASRKAQLSTIPAIVRELDDEQVLEVQLVENLKREDLHELEEAEGYEELLKRHGYTADTLALRIGKSRSYVYLRIQLLQLGRKARAAFHKGDLAAAVAQLLARIPNPKAQDEALAAVLSPQHGERLSYREAAQLIERQFMLQLSAARFDPRDAQLVPAAGACTTCPKRTGAHPELFADLKDKEVCTDTACFRAKLAAHNVQLVKKAVEAGRTVIKGEDAKKVAPHGASGNLAEGLIALDGRCWQDERSRTYRKIIGKALQDPVLVEDARSGEFFEAVRQGDYAAVLKEALPRNEGRSRSDADKTKEREARIETLARERILLAVHRAAPKTLVGEDLLAVALAVWSDTAHDAKLRLVRLLGWVGKGDPSAAVHAGAKRIEKLGAAELVQMIGTCVLVRDVRVAVHWINKGENLFAAAKRRGVDAAGLRKGLREELAAKKAGRSGRKAARSHSKLKRKAKRA